MSNQEYFMTNGLKALLLTVCAVAVLFLSACQTVTLPVPEGFAYYEKKVNAEMIRAVSPERVIYRIRPITDEPDASLDFWKTALETHFKKSGYIILEQKPVKAAAVPGISFVMASTYGGRDYTYDLNLFVYKKGVLLIEAAGEKSHFEKYRQQIDAAVAQTDFTQLECTFCQTRPLSVKTVTKGMSQD